MAAFNKRATGAAARRRGGRLLAIQILSNKVRELKIGGTAHCVNQEPYSPERESEDNLEIIAVIEKEYKKTMYLNQYLQIYLGRNIVIPYNLQKLVANIFEPRQALPSAEIQKCC
ncbi:hypothetical protein MMC32_004328 [Xylographa parallela]|nr:hypothetical protein [Xylographa parallela]